MCSECRAVVAHFVTGPEDPCRREWCGWVSIGDLGEWGEEGRVDEELVGQKDDQEEQCEDRESGQGHNGMKFDIRAEGCE